jgi:hypothetical protein
MNKIKKKDIYTLNGNFGSEVKVILNVILALLTVDDCSLDVI